MAKLTQTQGGNRRVRQLAHLDRHAPGRAPSPCLCRCIRPRGRAESRLSAPRRSRVAKVGHKIATMPRGERQSAVAGVRASGASGIRGDGSPTAGTEQEHGEGRGPENKSAAGSPRRPVTECAPRPRVALSGACSEPMPPLLPHTVPSVTPHSAPFLRSSAREREHVDDRPQKRRSRCIRPGRAALRVEEAT